MRVRTLVATGLAAGGFVLAGCGGSDEANSPARAGESGQSESQGPNAAEMPIQRAVNQLEQQGAKAARGVTGVSDSELLPSEQGAEFLVERGHIQLDQLCAANETEAEAERDPELARELDAAGLDLGWGERAFLDGWGRVAPPGRSEIGAGLYNALWIHCY